jgi:hypothetical protein
MAPILSEKDLQTMAAGIEETLGETTGTLYSRTFNATDNTWGPPYVAAAIDIPLDIASADSLQEEYVDLVLRQYRISMQEYRLITMPRSMLLNFPNVGVDWEVRVGANTYRIVAQGNADETQAVSLILHARKVGGTVA